MKLIKPVLRIFLNKFVLAFIAFAVWMLFFDQQDFGTTRARAERLRDLKTSERNLTGLIKDTKKELSLLKTSAASVEKYAREHFYMKKDNEELFIVKPVLFVNPVQ